MGIKELLKSTIFYQLLYTIKLNMRKRRWRNINRHNGTEIENMVNQSIIKVGCYTYGKLNVISYAEKSKLVIGHFCSIAENVTFLLDVEHYFNHISTFPYKVKVLHAVKSEAFSKGDIIIDDDVWIGYGATIMSGVHIGQGAVIASNSVVTKDVPPYAIVGGVPAKVIRYRFELDLIQELLKVDYSRLTKEKIEKHIDQLYVDLKHKEQLDWFE